jgi:hypothetical protein
LSGAAPICAVHGIRVLSHQRRAYPFNRPSGIVDKIVCKLSGTEPSNLCGSQYTEVFAFDQLPLQPGFDLVRHIKIDLWTGYQASDVCKGPKEDVIVLNVSDKWARDWLETGAGRDWLEKHDLPLNPHYAPDKECSAGDPQPIIKINLGDGEIIHLQY